MFAAFRQKILKSVFLTFKESLLAFNHCVNFWRKPQVIYQIAGYL